MVVNRGRLYLGENGQGTDHVAAHAQLCPLHCFIFLVFHLKAEDMHGRPEVSLPPRSWGWTRAYGMLRHVFRNATKGTPMVRGLESADCRPPKATHQPAHLPRLDGWRRLQLGARRRAWVGRHY